jgi:hypothetical protein
LGGNGLNTTTYYDHTHFIHSRKYFIPYDDVNGDVIDVEIHSTGVIDWEKLPEDTVGCVKINLAFPVARILPGDVPGPDAEQVDDGPPGLGLFKSSTFRVMRSQMCSIWLTTEV